MYLSLLHYSYYMGDPKRKDEARKEKILKVAGVLFQNKGFSSSTLQDVAIVSGESLDTILQLFPGDKLQILSEYLKDKRDTNLTKQLIVETTRAYIVKNGYAHVSTNHIAEETRRSVAILYKYFPKGRIDILKEILKQQVSDLMDFSPYSTIDAILSTFTDMEAFLGTMVQRFITMHEKNLPVNNAFTIAVLSDKNLFHEFNQVFEPMQHEMLGFMIQVMRHFHVIADDVTDIKLFEQKINRIISIMEQIILFQLNHGILFENVERMHGYLVRMVKDLMEIEFGSLNVSLANL